MDIIDGITHLGLDHMGCDLLSLYNEKKEGQLWRHVIFRVYSHNPCPVTGKEESYMIFFSCNDTYRNFIDTLSQIKKRYPDLQSELGKYSETRLCTPDDEYLLSSKMITQASIISFNPNRRGRAAFLNRKMIKNGLVKNKRFLIKQARKLPRYQFIKQFEGQLSDIAEFWRLCNSKLFIGDQIEEYFNIEDVSKPTISSYF